MDNKTMKMIRQVALVLVIVGAVNWGLYAFGFDLVQAIFGKISILPKIVYGLVGLSGLVLLPQVAK